MQVAIELDCETSKRLIRAAIAARRPVAWHAEVLLIQALGLEPEPLKKRTDAKVAQARAELCRAAR